MSSSDWPPPEPPKRHLWAGPQEPEAPPQPSPPPSPPPPPAPGRDLFPWIAGALAVAAVGATAGAIISSRASDRHDTTATSASQPAATTPTTPPSAPSTPPPPNPRHIVRSAVVGGATAVADDGVEFRVPRLREVRSIPHTHFVGPITGSRSRRLIRADIRYVNHTASPVDVFCGGYGASLRDSANHRHEPMHNYLDIKGNDEVCGTKVPPGGSTHVTLAFKIPRALRATGLYVYNAKAADFDGSDTKIFFARP